MSTIEIENELRALREAQNALFKMHEYARSSYQREQDWLMKHWDEKDPFISGARGLAIILSTRINESQKPFSDTLEHIRRRIEYLETKPTPRKDTR